MKAAACAEKWADGKLIDSNQKNEGKANVFHLTLRVKKRRSLDFNDRH